LDSSREPKPGEEPGKIRPKKAYEPPRIVFREPLEVVAAVCSPGKADFSCDPDPHMS
jgi:hypothetical protein